MTALQSFMEPTHGRTSAFARQSRAGTPFSKIIYVGDLSGEDSYGLLYAKKVAHEYQAELVVVHSLDPIVYALPGAALQDVAANAELTEMDCDPHRHGANHDSFVQREEMCADILEAARRHSASLIILGTLGQTTAGTMALATMARLILAETPCCILTVPSSAKTSELPPWLWENVIAATDFSPAGVAALDMAQRIARRGLVVLHSTHWCNELECHECMARLRLLAPFNQSHTLPVEHLVASGEVTAAIASLAERVHPDLLILGAPAVGIDSGHLNDSTIYRAIVASPCPVLLVPVGADGCGVSIDPATYAWMERVRCQEGHSSGKPADGAPLPSWQR